MPPASALLGNLALPVVAAPMFISSGPELVIAQCTAGIVGSFPALNARPAPVLREWLQRITAALAEHKTTHPELPTAPYAVNQIVHRSNDRLDEDVQACIDHRVPIIITSLGARPDINAAIHSYGGVVFHDVINNEFARKAIDKGADGLIAVAAGAGGHAGTVSPSHWFKRSERGSTARCCCPEPSGTAARFWPLRPRAPTSRTSDLRSCHPGGRRRPAYKDMIAASTSADIVYTNLFTGGTATTSADRSPRPASTRTTFRYRSLRPWTSARAETWTPKRGKTFGVPDKASRPSTPRCPRPRWWLVSEMSTTPALAGLVASASISGPAE